MTTEPSAGRPHDDQGAALILAIGFVLMVSAILGGLAILVTSSFNNRVALDRARNREYAADAAIEDAIAQLRSTSRSSLIDCGNYPKTNLNSIDIRVTCSSAATVTGSGDIVTGTKDNLVVTQRNVIFMACDYSNAVCTPANAIVTAQVNFEQTDTGGVSSTFVQSWSVNQ